MLNAKARNGDNAFSETQLKDSQDVHEGSSRIKTLQQDHEDDDSSVISSYAASVFSIRSLASSATDLAKASGYSVDDIATATEELLAIFHKDSDLAPLYLSAIEDSSIGPQRLQRNLRRIFKQYAEHLKSEANDQLEFLASRLVSSKAGFLAQSIVERCSEITVTMKHETLHNTGGEEKSDLGQKGKEEDDDHEDEEEEEEEASFVYNADFGDVVAFRKFLRNSDAFQSLRTQIQNFVLPKPSRITRPEVAIEGDDTGAHSEAKDQEQRGVKPTQILRRIMWTFDTFLVATGYLEPPLEPARVRLRWKCRCGESFTSDVRMYETDGVSELKAHVERVTGSEVTLTPYSRNSTNQRYVYQRPGLWLQKALTRLATTFKRTSKQCMLPQHNPNSNTTHSTQGTNSHHQNTNYLLACMHSGQYGKMLHQDCIDTIDTDRKLFCFLRQQFTHCRGRFRTILSLKKVKGIYFVRFNLFMSGSVEVRYHHQCCENTCECIPPKSLVEPSPQAEYRCKPAGPLKSGPPVLPDLLSHYFAKPSCIIDKDNSILSRLPKRISSELQGKLGEPVEGWGIYYQEGWDGDIITLVVVVMFLMGSLLFGILWSRLKMDVQGAFGVSAWIITAGALFIQLIVMRMGKV
ncbi:hypothetical protein K458DRAFT_300149 [Lentithecium fluviatile CBS 122367]|uniref:Uncharacterized protein n=1 Tax=Lentithecium fluviatile CBS 122367 TaxID=1168545 RepID=A0A6G1J685_9PLEO|nr:hypothetical protein K458DRAFT_300149 [Lentithecium fluviatile CBS 122367]